MLHAELMYSGVVLFQLLDGAWTLAVHKAHNFVNSTMTFNHTQQRRSSVVALTINNCSKSRTFKNYSWGSMLSNTSSQACIVTESVYGFNSDKIYADEANDSIQNMKYVTCIICVDPIIMFSLQAASTTHSITSGKLIYYFKTV